MDNPRSSNDLRFALPCAICNGSGGFGSRSDGASPHRDCRNCSGSGWNIKHPSELTATERDKFLRLLNSVH